MVQSALGAAELRSAGLGGDVQVARTPVSDFRQFFADYRYRNVFVWKEI
jgi:hypothetical protein